jgi:hypothetical protein
MVLEEVRRAVPSFGVAELHGLLHGYDDDRNCVAHAALTEVVDEDGMFTEQALLGLNRIVALHHRSSTSYQIH